MFQEFKKFALKGNVVDLAIGVIISGAFGKVVASLVDDVILPILGIIIGNINLVNLKWIITEEKNEVAELSIRYGEFLQATIDFFIVAFSIFIVIKAINSFRRKQEENPKKVQTSREEQLLTEIRDLLKRDIKH